MVSAMSDAPAFQRFFTPQRRILIWVVFTLVMSRVILALAVRWLE